MQRDAHTPIRIRDRSIRKGIDESLNCSGLWLVGVRISRCAVSTRNSTVHVVYFKKDVLSVRICSKGREVKIDRPIAVGINSELLPIIPQTISVGVRLDSHNCNEVIEVLIAAIFEIFPGELKDLTRKIRGKEWRRNHVVEIVRIVSRITRPDEFTILICICLRAELEFEGRVCRERLDASCGRICVEVYPTTSLG